MECEWRVCVSFTDALVIIIIGLAPRGFLSGVISMDVICGYVAVDMSTSITGVNDS